MHLFRSDYATLRTYAALQNGSLGEKQHPIKLDPLRRAARLELGACAASIDLLRFELKRLPSARRAEKPQLIV